MAIFNSSEEALNFLRSAKVFYSDGSNELNMNDTFEWGLAYGATVPDENAIEVAQLFWLYGVCGLYYWCTIHPDKDERIDGSQFEDIQRAIDFVRHEEKLRLSGMSSSEIAFHKHVYTLGDRVSHDKD